MRRMEESWNKRNNHRDNHRSGSGLGPDDFPWFEGEDYAHSEELITRAQEYLLAGDIDYAQICYQYAGLAGPDLSIPYIGLGVIAIMRGLMEEAKVCFEMALWLEDNSTQACCGMAVTLQTLADWKGAMRLYMRCLAKEPENFTALLGVLYLAILQDDLEEVLNHLKSEFTVDNEDIEMAVSFLAPFRRRIPVLKYNAEDNCAANSDQASGLLAELFVGSFCRGIIVEKSFSAIFILN